MSHACDVVNNMPEASDLSPVEKEGGKGIDFKSTNDECLWFEGIFLRQQDTAKRKG